MDRFDEAPEFSHQEKIRILRSEDYEQVYSAGKFIGALRELRPCIYICCDDDISYPTDYAETMAHELGNAGTCSVIGLHGSIVANKVGTGHQQQLDAPSARSRFSISNFFESEKSQTGGRLLTLKSVIGHLLANKSYLKDREVFHFVKNLDENQRVDTLGTGTIAFDTGCVRFNPLAWSKQDSVDLIFAIEMKRREIPMTAIRRKANWLLPLAENQSDSIYSGLVKDDSRATHLAQLLASMPDVDMNCVDEICGPMSPKQAGGARVAGSPPSSPG